MPRVYRVMKRPEDGKPVVEATGKGLGVGGEPVNGVTDVDRDESGALILNNRGMSVAPAWRDLPPFLIPKRLKSLVPRARGGADLFCFRLGDGPFHAGRVAPGWDLAIDDPSHGLIVPHASVPLAQFQADLAATRDDWTIDEA